VTAPVTDSGVWRRIQQGEPEAIETLVARYELHLINYLYRVTGDAAVAEQLFEQVMIEVVRQVMVGTAGENHKLEIFGLARQALRTWLSEVRTVDLEYTFPAADESEAQAYAALRSLSLERREAVVLKLFHKFSYSELAALLETTPTQARYEVEVGLARLSEALL